MDIGGYWKQDSFPIYLIPQFPRPLERHHPPCRQDGILTSGWISALAFLLVFYAELAEARYQDILTGFQGCLDNLKQGFNDFNGLVSEESEFIIDLLDDVVFRQRHGRISVSVMVELVGEIHADLQRFLFVSIGWYLISDLGAVAD